MYTIAPKSERIDVIVCENCGVVIADHSGGADRPPMTFGFCSDSCKAEWWANHKVEYEDPFDVY